MLYKGWKRSRLQWSTDYMHIIHWTEITTKNPSSSVAIGTKNICSHYYIKTSQWRKNGWERAILPNNKSKFLLHRRTSEGIFGRRRWGLTVGHMSCGAKALLLRRDWMDLATRFTGRQFQFTRLIKPVLLEVDSTTRCCMEAINIKDLPVIRRFW